MCDRLQLHEATRVVTRSTFATSTARARDANGEELARRRAEYSHGVVDGSLRTVEGAGAVVVALFDYIV